MSSGLTFIESGGLVCCEAENATTLHDGPTHSWDEISDGNAVGGAARQALPNNGTAYVADLDPDAPYMQWDIDFTTTGTYELWLRVNVNNDAVDNSIIPFFGPNGTEQDLGAFDVPVQAGYFWANEATTFTVASAGTYKLRIQMREDGFIVDRIVITDDTGYDPSTVNGGDGPAESSTTGGASGLSAAVLETLRRRGAI